MIKKNYIKQDKNYTWEYVSPKDIFKRNNIPSKYSYGKAIILQTVNAHKCIVLWAVWNVQYSGQH